MSLEQQITEFLGEHGPATVEEIATGVRARRVSVVDALYLGERFQSVPAPLGKSRRAGHWGLLARASQGVPRPNKTQKQRVLEVLADGRPHTHHELYQLGCVAHSRVADLRRDGYRIACWTATDRGDRVSVYQLVGGPLGAADAGMTPDPRTTPALPLSASAASSGPVLGAGDEAASGSLQLFATHPGAYNEPEAA